MMSWHVGSVVALMLAFLVSLSLSDDFYERLGVNKDAGSKEIRQAFKKLALKTHPDKNPDDPEAHEKFLKLNRAYEVLKDEELRNKYDQYGEEGLDENKGWGRYESWQYYQEEFGIYDDDDEIITLSKIDFESSVLNSGDLWFVNFFSPHCSHCHHLAPTWREVARELEGVLRIGAVNCGDEWNLCQQQGVRSYPSLLIYPNPQKYRGERTKRNLINFAMSFVTANVMELNALNFNETVNGEETEKSWLLNVCSSEEENCMALLSQRKLAAIVDKYFKFGSIDCTLDPSLCQQLKRSSGTFVYTFRDGPISESDESLDPQELSRFALLQLPLPKEINSWADVEKDVSNGIYWLVIFVKEISDIELEMRKLSPLLDSINVGFVNCDSQRSLCQKLHMKANQVAFYKRGGFEQHHGRLLAEDLAVFARASSSSHVLALTPDDFPERVINRRDPWVVDFFAPWCPPCMRLLPEFRKAAHRIGNSVSFGTVDCTVHSHLCNKMNIRSYPTTIFYNQSQPHQFHGTHSAKSIVEFIEDTLNPKMITLTTSSFDEMVRSQQREEVWLIDFYAPWCGPCQQLIPVWNKVARILKEKARVAKVDCVSEDSLCQREGISSYPTMRLYPSGRTGTGHYSDYSGWRDVNSIRAWAMDYLPSKVKLLSMNDINNEVLEDSTPWLVDFYAPWCGHCVQFAPNFERVSELMEGKVKCGKVNCDEQRHLCNQAQVRAYPSLYFYEGANGRRQNLVGVSIGTQSVNGIINTVQQHLSRKKKSASRDEL
ncbi:dnaJ homolog subfamily C member 10-like [Oscarella lobularis]|uniref:dnaJ homolog subfamily C member 10-like n=1 Tax=Oscarella lobularis TaxID=121494 RepID=UPI0033130B49